MAKFTKKIESTSEYKEVVEHANALDFEPTTHSFYGSWETAGGEPIYPQYNDKIEGVGRKYFQLRFQQDGEWMVEKIRPAESSIREKGYIHVTFEER